MVSEADPTTTLATVNALGGRGAMHQEAPPGDLVPPGTSIGRFVVTGLLGEGGMGVVYAARDPVLERRVAIKLWRPSGVDAEAAERARARLLREAQALAQFAHQNIVAVHEFGTHEDGVFLAMELVEGQTLREWSKAKARSPFEVMQVLRAAGAGLAAAHRAGIVHRDFKPDNVIVPADGRVRVVDFGLARSVLGVPEGVASTAGRVGEGTSSVVTPTKGSSQLSSPVTLHGTIVGTPRYMAPEQHLGAEADALADQFSFCVTAFECLHGAPPFAPQRIDEPRTFTLREPMTKAVPARWRRAIVRGLSTDKGRRFPSMDALLRELAYDPRAARRRALWALAAVLLLAVPTTAWVRAATLRAPAPCAGSREQVAAVWDDAARARVAAAFAASRAPRAEQLARRFVEVMDDYARGWAAARATACEDTRVRGALSEHVLALRTHCLDGRLDELRGLASIYAADPDAPTVTRALEAAHRLGRLQTCSDVEALTAPAPPPDDPAVRARIDDLEKRLRDVLTLVKVGHPHDALVAARPLVNPEREVGYAPLLGRTLLEVGRLEAVNGDAKAGEARLREALDVAGQVVDDTLFIDVLAELVYEVGYDDARYEEALRMGSIVTPLLQRKTVEDGSRALFVSHLGVVRWANGERGEAEKLFLRALGMLEARLGKDAPELSPDLDNLGNVAAETHRPAEARAYYERSLAVVRKAYGEDHPDVARTLLNLGSVLGDEGNHDEAIAADQRALAIFEALYGSKHMMVAAVCNNLGEELVRVGRNDEALAACQKALAAGDATLEPEHPLRAYHQLCVARADIALARYDEARPYVERAEVLRSRSPNPKDRAEVKMLLAEALWHRPADRARARRLFDEARAVYASSDDGAKVLAEIDAWKTKP